MLLVIHNLPLEFRHVNVKNLINERCGLTEIIVDKLIVEGKSKRVTVGLADEADAAILMNNLNGLYLGDHQLYIEEKQTQRNAQQMANACQPTPGPSGLQQGQVPQFMQAQYNNQLQYSNPSNNVQFQQLFAMPFIQPQMCPPPNISVPFFMTSQNPNDSNNQQFMVQYPQVQASSSSNQCNEQNFGFNPKQDDSRSQFEHSSNPSWDSPRNESDFNKSGNGRDGGRIWPRDNNGPNEVRSYSRSNVYSFQNKSNHKGKSHKISPWEQQNPQNVGAFEGNSFGESSKTFDLRDKIKHLHDQFRESQEFGEHVLSDRDSNKLSPQNNFFKNKRPNNDTFKFGPHNKKFGNNQQFMAKNRQNFERHNFNNPVRSGQPNIKGNNPSSRPNLPRIQQNRQMQQSKTPQKMPNMPGIQSSRPQMQSNRPQPFANKVQFQGNAQTIITPKKHSRQTIRSLMHLEKLKIEAKALLTKVQMHPNTIVVQSSPRSEVSETSTTDVKSWNTKAEAPKMLQKVDVEQKKKWEAWLVQATVVIAKQISYNAGICHEKKDPVFLTLKQRVRARLDETIGDNITLNLRNMLDLYRDKYSAEFDKEYYDEVKKAVDTAHCEKFEANQKAKDFAESAGDLAPIAVEPTPGSSKNANDLPTTKKPPKTSDNSNKIIKKLPTVLSSQLRKTPREEYYEVYMLDKKVEKALNAELDKFCDLFMEEIQDPKDLTEQPVCKYMGEVIVHEMREAVKVNVKRRIMDVRSYLVVKVICRHNIVPFDLMKEFLKPFGVTQVRGTKRNKYMYFATCDTYENFDALCKMSNVEIGNSNVFFIPLHILGQPKKFKKKHDLAQASNYAGEDSSDDDPQTDEEYETIMEDEIKSMPNIITIDDDVQSKDVIVIDGDDDTVTTDKNAASVTDGVVVIKEKVHSVIDDRTSITIDSKVIIVDDDNAVAVDDASSLTATNDEVVTVDCDDNKETVTNDDEVVTVINDSGTNYNPIVAFCCESVNNDDILINIDNESIHNEGEVVTDNNESDNNDGKEVTVDDKLVNDDLKVVTIVNKSVNSDGDVVTVYNESVNNDGEVVSVNNDPVVKENKTVTCDDDKVVTIDNSTVNDDEKVVSFDNEPVTNDKDKKLSSFDEATVSDEYVPQICKDSDNKIDIDEDIDINDPNINEDDLEDF